MNWKSTWFDTAVSILLYKLQCWILLALPPLQLENFEIQFILIEIRFRMEIQHACDVNHEIQKIFVSSLLHFTLPL